MYENIIAAAEQQGIAVTRDADMSKHITFRVGGPADLLVEPDSKASLAAVLKACKAEGVTPLILGKGSNVLVKDEGLRRVVILMGDAFAEVEYLGDNTFRAEAGASVTKLCKAALEQSCSGLEFAYGIPGSVGGGVYMNAGAYGGELKDVITSVDYMDLNGEEGTFDTAEQLGFGYRHSNFMESGLIVTSVLIQLEPGDPETIKATMDDILGRRKAKQPLEYPSAGSTFKRPEGYFAGALIQECGLKGFSLGGAQVSDKHAGFVINKDHATATDILALINHVQTVVKEQTGVLMEPEVRIL